MAISRSSLMVKFIASAAVLAMIPLVFAAARINAVAARNPNSTTLERMHAVFAGSLDPALLTARANLIAQKYPLDPSPFFIAAAIAGTEQQPTHAIALLQEVIRRRATFGAPRAWLATYYFYLGRDDEAIDQADAAMRADGTLRRQLMPLLLPKLATRTGRAHLVRIIANSPDWSGDFINFAQAHDASPDAMFAMLGSVAASGVTPLLADQRAKFIESRINAGDPERAYLAWISFLPPDSVNHIAPIYDGDFAHFPGPQPFNWALAPGDDVDVDYDFEGQPTNSFLNVSYAGSAPREIASQELFLQPGRWRLAMSIRGARSADSGSLRWRLRCVPAENEIGSIGLDMLGPQWQRATGLVQIPATGCAVQLLTLIGSPGNTTEPVSLQVREMVMRLAEPVGD